MHVPRPLRLLVVASHPQIASVTAGIIQECGVTCEADYAADDANAIQTIPTVRPDVVVLDADSSRYYDPPARCRRVRDAFPDLRLKILYLGWDLDQGTIGKIHLVGAA